MTVRRIAYLAALLGAVVFYWAYREWLSWFFLLGLLLLPWFSLAVSLPAMVTCRAVVECPGAVQVGDEVTLQWKGHSFFPMPRLRGKLQVCNTLTGQTFRLRSGDLLPTEHCGELVITLHRPRCLDYLGLFSLPVARRERVTVLVRPVPVSVDSPPDTTRCQASLWRPKAGGGFSENHELRLYRPGDSLRQVHWKLSAKTGQLILREPMEALRNRVLLTLELQGSGEQLNEKLGRLHWMSQYLLRSELPHTVCCLTGLGVVSFPVNREEDVQQTVDALLRCPKAEEGTQPTHSDAGWHYRIGGDGNG